MNNNAQQRNIEDRAVRAFAVDDKYKPHFDFFDRLDDKLRYLRNAGFLVAVLSLASCGVRLANVPANEDIKKVNAMDASLGKIYSLQNSMARSKLNRKHFVYSGNFSNLVDQTFAHQEAFKSSLSNLVQNYHAEIAVAKKLPGSVSHYDSGNRIADQSFGSLLGGLTVSAFSGIGRMIAGARRRKFEIAHDKEMGKIYGVELK